MFFRRTALALSAFAALTAASAAQAERLHTGGIPLSASTARMGAGIAAGFGRHDLVDNQLSVSTNVAAGIGNTATQQVAGVQGGGPAVGLDFSGNGPMVKTRFNFATNVAAGIASTARQGVSTLQR